jgi:hypothetical protein
MSESYSERCTRLCGTVKEHCFIGNKKQILCISDIVLNKISVIKVMIESALERSQDSELGDSLHYAVTSIEELTSWIKFLRIAHDLREFGASFFEGGIAAERRREKRYPLPEIYQTFIRMEIQCPGGPLAGQLIDFSRKGLQFLSSAPLEPGSLAECVLSTRRLATEKTAFSMKIKYCIEKEGAFTIGARIEDVADEESFNVFNTIYTFIFDLVSGKDGNASLPAGEPLPEGISEP